MLGTGLRNRHLSHVRKIRGIWMNRDNTIPLSAILSVLAGGVLISFSSIFVRMVSVNPDVAAFYRTFLGGLTLGCLALIRRERFSISPSLMAWLAGSGVCLALDLTSWHRSIPLVGPGLATVLINFQVFFLAVAGWWFLKEKPPLHLVFAIPMGLLGVWLMVGGGFLTMNRAAWAGIIWGLGAAFWFGSYTFTVRMSQAHGDTRSGIVNMAVIAGVSSVLLAVYCAVTGQSLIVTNSGDVLWLVLYGVSSQGLAWLLISFGLPKLPVYMSGMTILIMPTLSFVWDVLFFDRPTGGTVLYGAILAITAIGLGVYTRKDKIGA